MESDLINVYNIIYSTITTTTPPLFMPEDINTIGSIIYELFTKYDRLFLSFDCANKTLAYTNLTINAFAVKLLNQLIIIDLDLILDDKITLYSAYLYAINSRMLIMHGLRCLDILSGVNLRDTTIVQRTNCLFEFLRNEPLVTSDDMTVLIEEQPKIMNPDTTVMQGQLVLYFLQMVPKENIILMKPGAKNQLRYTDKFAYRVFLSNANSKYEANKAHSTAIFLDFAEKFKFINMIPVKDYAVIDNTADSFTQLLAYLQNETQ